MQNLYSVVELSRGSVWKPAPEEPPYLIAPPSDPWPAGASAYAVFYDSTGSQIANINAGTVTADRISFQAASDVVDPIPTGASFEMFIVTSDGPRQIRYGTVVRREAMFFVPPPTATITTALLFTDTFPTLGLRSTWKPALNRVKVYDNTGSIPNSMGTDSVFFDKGAVRWETPLNGDSPRMHFQLVAAGSGKTTAIVCADQRLTSGLGVQFDTGANTIHLLTVAGPVTLTDKITPVSHTLTSLNDYYVTYSATSKTLAVYLGTNLTPIATWVDTTSVVPHGLGYRYVGFSWQASLSATGPQVCSFNAKDDV